MKVFIIGLDDGGSFQPRSGFTKLNEIHKKFMDVWLLDKSKFILKFKKKRPLEFAAIRLLSFDNKLVLI